jgi:spore coat protein U-like protein
MRRLLIVTTALIGVVFTQDAWAQAQTTTATIAVTASVAATCSVTASTLSFLTVTALNIVNANATVHVTCTTGATYEVALDPGLHVVSNQRNLVVAGGATLLPYNLYQDAGYSIPWGDTLEVNTKEGTGTGGAQALTVYGQIPSQATVTTGVYTDTVTVTVTY